MFCKDDLMSSLPTHHCIQIQHPNSDSIKEWKNFRDHSYFNASEVIRPCFWLLKFKLEDKRSKRMEKIFTRAM